MLVQQSGSYANPYDHQSGIPKRRLRPSNGPPRHRQLRLPNGIPKNPPQRCIAQSASTPKSPRALHIRAVTLLVDPKQDCRWSSWARAGRRTCRDHGRNCRAEECSGCTCAASVSETVAGPVQGRYSSLESSGTACVTRHLGRSVPVHGPKQTDRFGSQFLPKERPDLRPLRLESCSLERNLAPETQELIDQERHHD